MTVPVTVLTGFLGSGKTTLLNRLLADPALADALVLVNEVGAVPIDHALVADVREDVVVLASGCVCCSVRNDLVRALCDAYVKATRGELPKFSRVLLETTGLADPTAVVQTLVKNGLVARGYHLAQIVTTFDGALGVETLFRHPEATRQLALADRIVLTKCDTVAEDDLARVEALLAGRNPLAPIQRAARGETPIAPLLAGAPPPNRRLPLARSGEAPSRKTPRRPPPSRGRSSPSTGTSGPRASLWRRRSRGAPSRPGSPSSRSSTGPSSSA